MIDPIPDQERLWNAYGHAMGAAMGVELIVRWFNFHKRALALHASLPNPNFEAKKEKLIRNAFEGTFGQLVTQFKHLHSDSYSPLLWDALDNAVEFRNRLSHKFLGQHLRHLRTEEGLDIAAIECSLYTDHFSRLERHLRENIDFEWEIFEQVTTFTPDAQRHPFEDWLAE